jgi:hypothetical protein
MSRLFALLVVGAALGCSNVDEIVPPTPEPGPARFESDAPGTSPAIALELRALTDDALMLDVVGHGLQSVYGIAFRIETDPAVLMLDTLEGSSLWEPMPRSLVRSVEPRPGLGIYVMTAQGRQLGIAADGDVLGTLHFRRQPGDSPVRFVADRNAVVDDHGLTLGGVAWTGGTLRGP